MKTPRIAAILLGAAALSGIGLAGCGSDSSSSAPADTAAADTAAAVDTTAADTTGGDFTASANQICTDNVAATKAAVASTDPNDLASFQAGIQAVADGARSSLDQLQQLEPPADAADAYATFLAAREKGVTNAEATASSVAAATDLDAAKQAVITGATGEVDIKQETQAAAQAVGLDACGTLGD